MIIKGQKINDRYEIIKTIGEGGMANVYLAEDTILNRQVAVKILRGDLASDEKFVRRFQREAISASSLSHPNIVEMYDVGEDDGKYFIVMEYVEGKTLKSLIKKRGGLTLPETIDIMLQLTDGIACAHDSYIIHRDIKPQNVLILDDGRVKITDFGISQAMNRQELTETNSVMGSVHYIPPEQANGTGTTIKSDIYSLGILMFELLTGKVPFKGDNAVEIAIKQMKDPMPSIVDIKEDIPQSIENVILKATAKNPKNRYDSAMEMHDDIKTALSRERADEERIKFLYPEQETKAEDVAFLSRSKKNATREKEKESETDEMFKEEKKTNKAIWITAGIVAFLAIIAVVIIFILPKTTKVPDVEVPDVSGLTVIEAEKELEKLGLEVEATVQEKYDEEVEAGNVIKTNPQAGRTVKEGTTVTITVSLGLEGFLAEDYTKKDYVEVKANLEARGINVVLENKEYTVKDEVEENIIISQDVEVGKQLKKGDTVTLIISKIIVTYPDFTDGTWNKAGLENFCDKNNITLRIKTLESSSQPVGTIYSQDRAADSKVVAGVTLTIVVIEAPATTTPTTPTDGNA